MFLGFGELLACLLLIEHLMSLYTQKLKNKSTEIFHCSVMSTKSNDFLTLILGMVTVGGCARARYPFASPCLSFSSTNCMCGRGFEVLEGRTKSARSASINTNTIRPNVGGKGWPGGASGLKNNGRHCTDNIYTGVYTCIPMLMMNKSRQRS